MRVVVVTSTRADFGILLPVIRAMQDVDGLEVRIVATGTHLSRLHGRTLTDIEKEGLRVDETFDAVLADDSAAAAAKSTALAMLGAVDALERVTPDLVLLLGDRSEILAIATAAVLLHLPVAHLCGGDTTEGALDDQFRHAITKLSHLHFTTHSAATALVAQLGESPDNVHEVGHPALDALTAHSPMPRAALLDSLGLEPAERLCLLTYHPPTNGDASFATELDEVLAALDEFPELALVATGSNADEGGSAVTQTLQEYTHRRPRSVFHASLGPTRFYDVLHHASFMIGNSSSGILEAPSIPIPTINVGERQKGRPRASSVIDVVASREAIRGAITRSLESRIEDVASPFGDGRAAQRIAEILARVEDPKRLLRKRFHHRTFSSSGRAKGS